MTQSSPPRTRGVAALLTLLGTAALCAQLAAAEIIADRDAHIFGGPRPSAAKAEIPAQDSNFGAAKQLELKTTPGKSDNFTRKVYIGFDLANLTKPPAAVSLRLTVHSLTEGPAGDRKLTEQPLSVHLLKKAANGNDWAEGSGDANMPEHGPSTGSIHWLDAPANYVQAGSRVLARDTVEAARIVVPADVKPGHTLTIPLSAAALAELAQRGPTDRATFILVIEEGTDDMLRLHSREATRPGFRPALVW